MQRDDLNIVERLEKLSRRAYYLKERYARMHSNLYSCGSKVVTVKHQGKEIVLPRVQTSIRTDKLTDDVINLIDLENQLSSCKREINNIISCIEAPNLHTVLQQKYLHHLSTKQIAIRWKKTQRWIQMLLKQAENQLLEQFENNKFSY